MLISFIKKERIINFSLPERVNGNYWITNVDSNNIEENFINIEASDAGWKLISNIDVEIIEQKDNMEFVVPFVVLDEYKLYTLQSKKDNSRYFLCTLPSLDKTDRYVSMPLDKEITIGSKSNCNIVYTGALIKEVHAKLLYDNVRYTLVNNNESFGIYVNNKPVMSSVKIMSGDVIFILGLKIIIIYDKQGPYMIINNPNNSVSFDDTIFRPRNLEKMPYNVENEEDNIELTLYSENDYFHKKPRFMKLLEEVEMNIDAPPSKESDRDQNLLLTVGPMITTGMTSMVTMYSALNNIFTKNATLESSIPSLLIAGSMLLATIMWPTISKITAKRERKSREKQRQKKYQQYIESKRKFILEKMKEQEEILNEKFLPLTECEKIIHEKNMKLWERKLDEADFLQCSLGYGTMPMKIKIKYPEEHFSLEDDILKKEVSNLGTEKKDLVNVPITISLYEKYIVSLIGEHLYSKKLVDNMLFQLFTFHSYDELKIVILTNKDKEADWQDYKICPYIWNDERTIRYFATNVDEIREICFNLDRVYQARTEKENDNYREEKKKYNPHYLIITDVFKNVRNQDFIKHVLEQKENDGFSLLILNDSVSSLPNECKNFINTSNDVCEVYENVLNNESVKFKIDFESQVNFYEAFRILSNTPIEISRNGDAHYPDKIGFLEMYQVGKVEQLNPLERWRVSNPMISLSAPIGAGKNGEIISLDLHEKNHGPHGLIAGMTGSGKSEFIITYILSMAINYHPYEVQFILIDYKGGGVAGAFEKSDMKLPHLAGTITNLDANEINRSLSSIQSELKRRQKIFNDARTISGESTIDIYKYQKLYREKVVSEPVSHLFIISDEFAELKQQQPDFMQQLISTARIGRSLGVHLILATQKPSGVVDNQIWSNTRFRVCLRVQEKSDSTEVIKCPDAAFIKHTGRFYLQVGYNEIFELGQAAWAGGQYFPAEKLKKTVNTEVDFINNIGTIYKNVNTEKKNANVKSMGEELTNIVKYLDAIAKEEQINARRLWLDRIKEYINIKDTISKYNFTKIPYSINVAIGEFDDPTNQQQHILSIPFTDEGNAIVYGSTGSGKENLLTTLLYSGIITYSSNELNFYIVDFGSEALRSFSKFPHVGDVVLISDSEKFANLFKMLNSILETRKQLFVDYNGEYQYYCKRSGNTLPAIIAIINNFESYVENYSEYDDNLIQLTREGAKYGIYFILTASNPNTIKSKIRQNFSQDFVLQMNNEMDYSSILGSVGKNYPSKIFGRGIIKKGSVYEFQTAFVAPREEIVEFVREEAEKYALDTNAYKASKIPTLPEVVSYSDIKDEYVNTNEIIIGVNKDELVIEKMDYLKDTISLITSVDYERFGMFINPFINQIISKNLYNINVINCEDIELNPKYIKLYNYYNNAESLFLTDLENTINEKYDLYEQSGKNNSIFENTKHNLYIIIGINTLLEKTGKQQEFGNLMSKADELGIFNFIFIDVIDKIKKIEIELWYKNCVRNNYGIWLGEGIADQYTLKLMRVPRELRDEIDNNFCYVVKNGKAILVKYVENFELNV